MFIRDKINILFALISRRYPLDGIWVLTLGQFAYLTLSALTACPATLIILLVEKGKFSLSSGSSVNLMHIYIG